jgi:predicted GNAT family N-acyltransferase
MSALSPEAIAMEEFIVKIVDNDEELKQVMKIREIVFIQEQAVPHSLEKDGLDNGAKHVIAFYKDKPVGCARIRFIGSKAKLERLALLRECRGMGLGKAMMLYMVDYCRNQNASEMMMHAQYYLKDFYESLGFVQKGEPFMEAGIKHIEMSLS